MDRFGVHAAENGKAYMTDKLIVLLVSEQTVPNIQFLKWHFRIKPETVDLLFISTEIMERKKKTADIMNALAYLERYIPKKQTLTVNENSIGDVKNKLEKLLGEWHHKSFAVNITGGTKLMSLATYDFFKDKKDCQIFYQPIGKELQCLGPKYAEYSVSELLTLEEYMKAHGINFEYNNSCLKDYDFNKSVYERVIKDSREAIKQIVAMQNNSYFKNIFKRKNTLDLTQVSDDKFVTSEGQKLSKEEVIAAVSAFGFDIHALTHSQLRYITGGWFEEFAFQKIKHDNKIADGNIALNVRVEKGSDKNELDVVYIADNRLHVVECKSFVDGKEGTFVLNDALFKLQAIMKTKFGLNAKSYLYTKSIVEKKSALSRAQEFGITIVDGKSL